MKKVKIDKSDALFTAGALVICCGVSLISAPAAIILFGIFLILAAVDIYASKRRQGG